MQNALGNHRDHAVTLGAWATVQQLGQFEFMDGQEYQFDMSVGQGGFDVEGVLRVDERFIFEHFSESFDFFGRPVREVGDGAFTDFSMFSPAFSEEDGRRGVSVGDDIYIHGNYYSE